MSLRAMLWALHDAPVDDATAVLVLLGLADHAHDDGTASWPSRALLARYARCSTDTVDRRLRTLLTAGVIVPGDQRLVETVRANRRPTVYDLVLTARRVLEVPADEPEATPIQGPQAAAPDLLGAADGTSRGRTPAVQGPQLCGTEPSLNRPEPARADAAPRRSSYRPRRRGPERVDPSDAVAGYCRRCAHQHAADAPCSLVAAPRPPDFRAIAEAARREAAS